MSLSSEIMQKCRLCQQNEGTVPISSNNPLCLRITESTAVKIHQDLEKLPHFICSTCEALVNKYHDFRQMCNSVDDKLRLILTNIGDVKDEDVTIEVDSYPIVPPKCLFCDVCGKRVKSGKELQNHVETHSATKHACQKPGCRKSYTTSDALRKHEQHHDGNRRFLCVTCGKKFLTKHTLSGHEKTHSDVKPYVCDVCSQQFRMASNLNVHKKKHHEGRRFYCSQCAKPFLTLNALQRHELVHSGVKEFGCESCPAAFYTKKELAKHVRYHQGIRLYHCDTCFKSFFEKHHLTIHSRLHSGERPYRCTFPECGKCFYDSPKLARHFKIHKSKT